MLAGEGSRPRSGLINYSYTHQGAGSAAQHYRLGQRDLDGTTVLFGVRYVGPETGAEIRPYPNPARAGNFLSGLPASAEVEMTDFSGRKVLRQVTDNGTLQLPANLKAGVYLLRGEDWSQRIVIR